MCTGASDSKSGAGFKCSANRYYQPAQAQVARRRLEPSTADTCPCMCFRKITFSSHWARLACLSERTHRTTPAQIIPRETSQMASESTHMRMGWVCAHTQPQAHTLTQGHSSSFLALSLQLNLTPSHSNNAVCTAIANSNNAALLCTNAGNSRGNTAGGFKCDVSYWLNTAGPVDVCSRMCLLRVHAHARPSRMSACGSRVCTNEHASS